MRNVPERDASDAPPMVDDTDVFAAVTEPAKWNSWAALVAGVAA